MGSSRTTCSCSQETHGKCQHPQPLLGGGRIGSPFFMAPGSAALATPVSPSIPFGITPPLFQTLGIVWCSWMWALVKLSKRTSTFSSPDNRSCVATKELCCTFMKSNGMFGRLAVLGGAHLILPQKLVHGLPQKHGRERSDLPPHPPSFIFNKHSDMALLVTKSSAPLRQR